MVWIYGSFKADSENFQSYSLCRRKMCQHNGQFRVLDYVVSDSGLGTSDQKALQNIVNLISKAKKIAEF